MWAKLKALRLRTKVVIALFLALLVYGATHQPQGPGSGDDPSGSGAGSDEASRLLRQYEAQYAEVTANLRKCAEEMQQTTNQMQAAALSGGMPLAAQPPCMQSYPQWIAQAAFLEAQISRLRTGDRRSLSEITGIPVGSTGGGRSSGSATGGDGGTDAVERWDRGAIRGTSMYVDENGDSHELPTAKYYFHDLQSGRFIPSQSPTPPNDGRDYAPMAPRE